MGSGKEKDRKLAKPAKRPVKKISTEERQKKPLKEVAHDSNTDKSPPEVLSEGSVVPREGRIEIREVSYTGPLPPPGAMADYEKVLPGMADRIVTMAEKEQKAGAHHIARLMYSRFVLSALVILLGFYAVYEDYIWLGALAGIFGSATAFLRNIVELWQDKGKDRGDS